MPFKGIAAIALVASLTSACAMIGETTAPTAKHAYAGVYGGSYVCTDGEHGFYLDITSVSPKDGGGFNAAGVIGLFPTLAGISGPVGGVAGSLKVSGTITADGTLAMTCGDWLKQPAGYGAADLEGRLIRKTDGSYALTGKPVVRGNPTACSNLIATQFLP